jgi:hypothetical protein
MKAMVISCAVGLMMGVGIRLAAGQESRAAPCCADRIAGHGGGRTRYRTVPSEEGDRCSSQLFAKLAGRHDGEHEVNANVAPHPPKSTISSA